MPFSQLGTARYKKKTDLDVRILLLKEFPCACYCTPGSYPHDQGIDFPSGVSPYFGASGIIMCLKLQRRQKPWPNYILQHQRPDVAKSHLGIGRVFKLLKHVAIRRVV